MMLSRRSMLAVAAGEAVLAQENAPLVVLNSASGLRLERHGNPQLPSVALFLPKATDPSVVVEMPEHAWRKETANAEQAWFYRMYGSDPAVKGQVKWSRPGNALA